MRAAAAVLLLAVASASAPALSQSLGLDEAAPAAPPRQPRADTDDGRAVAMGGTFGELRVACAACHRLDGAGDPSGAFPRLAGQSGWYLYSTLRAFADGRRPSDVMTPVARLLSDLQMQDVAAFYAASRVPGPAPALAQDRPAIERGRDLAESAQPGRTPAACALCHGPAGAGRPPLYPYLAGQHAAYLERQLELFQDGRRRDDPMGIMAAVAKQLSPAQMKDAAAYYAALPPAPAAAASVGGPVESGSSQ
jgi:cytochrome c553